MRCGELEVRTEAEEAIGDRGVRVHGELELHAALLGTRPFPSGSVARSKASSLAPS